MRKKITVAVVLVMIVSVVLSLAGCSKSDKEIRTLIADFENSCNSLDFNGILECINPKISDKFRFAAGVVGMFTEKGTDELFDALSDMVSGDNVSGTDFFSSIHIEINEIEINEDNADVLVELTYYVGEEEFVRDATIECMYYKEQWYISGISLN